jgi:hypothetical protein
MKKETKKHLNEALNTTHNALSNYHCAQAICNELAALREALGNEMHTSRTKPQDVRIIDGPHRTNSTSEIDPHSWDEGMGGPHGW